jgi:hypothetical protein
LLNTAARSYSSEQVVVAEQESTLTTGTTTGCTTTGMTSAAAKENQPPPPPNQQGDHFNTPPPTLQSNKGGRKHGDTYQNREKRKNAKAAATTEVVKRYQAEKAKHTGNLPKGTLMKIEKDVAKQFGLDDSFNVPFTTVTSCITVGNLEGMQTQSPLRSLEPMLVIAILASVKQGDPLEKDPFLAIVMSMIKGKPLEQELIKYRRTHFNMEGDLSESPLTDSWYRGFLQRNSPWIRTARGKLVEAARHEWATLDNYVIMYDLFYNLLVRCKIAEVLEEEDWWYGNTDGNPVACIGQAFGKPIKHNMLHPGYVVVYDECGSNTSMKNDGEQGGKHFLTGAITKVDGHILDSTKAAKLL